MTTAFSYTLTVGPSGASPAASASGNLVEITDHEAQGLVRLIPEYQETPRWQEWIKSFLTTVQEMEVAIHDAWENVINLDAAVGAQLDLIGTIVAEDRDGRSDADYRLALKVRVLVSISQGRVEQLIAICSLFTDLATETGAYIRIRENQPAGLEIRIVRRRTWTRGELDKRLRQAKAAGVTLQTLILQDVENGKAFTFVEPGDYPEKAISTGFSDGALGSVAGGTLMDVLD